MRHRILLVAGAAMVLSAAAANADLGDQLFKLLPEDGAPGDQFGKSVAVSGTTAIIGAWYDDDNGNNSGSAYLFDITTGQQIAKLLPNDGTRFDYFGISVAISGITVIVGTLSGEDDNGTNSGSAYLFDISDSKNPSQIAKLLPDDGAANDGFGWSVAINGTTAIVGAPQDDDNGDNSGSAYLFDISDPKNPSQIAKFLPDDGAAGDNFGRSVAISGTTAIIGAYHDDDNGNNSGSAYLFDIGDSENPSQIGKLLPDDGAEDDRFGLSVAVNGTTAIVGADLDNANGTNSGSAYLFDITTGQQIAKLLPDDGAEDDQFGFSVSISGATAIVGSVGDDDNGGQSGSAYLFDSTTGQQIAKLLPDDGAAGDNFGRSVAIRGTTAIVGAFRDAAYVFDATRPPCVDTVDCDDGLFCNGAEGCSEGTCVSGLAPCDEDLCSEELDACVECLDDSHCNDSDACTQDACDPDTGACPHDPVVCDDEDACTTDSCDPAFGCQYEPLDCLGDLNCDGVVDATDLAILLGAWGPCPEPPEPCPADIHGDGDGIVRADDLAQLLGDWGPCP